jgi:hypothetical protein
LPQGLRNVGGNIRDTVMAKPKQLAHRLRHKFGSADNLSSIGADAIKEDSTPGACSSLPRYLSGYDSHKSVPLLAQNRMPHLSVFVGGLFRKYRMTKKTFRKLTIS